MKKETKKTESEMKEEYDFSKGIRGKYAQGNNIVILSRDVAEVFPDSESVNEALCLLIKIANQSLGSFHNKE